MSLPQSETVNINISATIPTQSLTPLENKNVIGCSDKVVAGQVVFKWVLRQAFNKGEIKGQSSRALKSSENQNLSIASVAVI